jgi:hypothetical protein
VNSRAAAIYGVIAAEGQELTANVGTALGLEAATDLWLQEQTLIAAVHFGLFESLKQHLQTELGWGGFFTVLIEKARKGLQGFLISVLLKEKNVKPGVSVLYVNTPLLGIA